MKKKILFGIACVLIGFFAFAIGTIIGDLMRKKLEPSIKIESLTDSIHRLQKSYNIFKSMSGEQLVSVWNQLFHDAEYKMDGKIRENEYDCGTAETKFWKVLGGNVVYENTEMKELRLQRVSQAYTKINDVQIGDIIIFKRDGKYGHIAVIHRVNKKTLGYMDMNVIDDGPGYNTIAFNDPRIQGVYAMSFDYFCGDILNKFEKK
jgi:hypothetical protein